MKQRVAIARGMAMEPDILLMDEPFASLDALTRRQMQEELLQLWEDTRFTVLFVTHAIEEACIVGSRILVLSPHPGQVKAELNAHHLGHENVGDEQFLIAPAAHSRNAVRRPRPREGGRAACLIAPPRPTCAKSSRRVGSAPPTSTTSPRPLSPWERISNLDSVRKLTILVTLVVIWELYTRIAGISEYLLPRFSDTGAALSPR